MKSFVALFALVALVAADVSHILPSGPEASATINSQTGDVGPDGFQYGFQTSNGIQAEESGILKQLNGKNEAAVIVQGSNSYTAPDGTVVQIRFVADENGYQPEGNHLPTPPPTQAIPEAIARSLAYIAAHPPQPETNIKY